MTLDVLICTHNKGIVKVADIIMPRRDDVRYIVSFQYSDERFLELVPDAIAERSDVLLLKQSRLGLSANRNEALAHATADLLVFVDDDTRFAPDGFDRIFATFGSHAEVDMAFFQATTYTGKPFREYPEEEADLSLPRKCCHTISAIEMVCRREKVQGRLRFDERFGLGAGLLTCFEEDIWLVDARRLSLNIRYFPIKIVETSTLLKNQLLLIDPGVQRSFGAKMYYQMGARAYARCFAVAVKAAMKGMAHFLPLMRNFAEGISYIKHTPREA